MMRREQQYLILVLSLLVFFGLFCIRLDERFWGHFEGGSIWIASSIRTFNEVGIDTVHYLPVRPLRTFGPTNLETLEYYLHHPPVIVWLAAISTWLFGYDVNTGMPFESSLRILGVLFTLPTLALVYTLARRLTNARVALVAFFLYSLSPMVIYYSRTPYYDMLVMPFILLFAYVFLKWMQNFTMLRTWGLIALAIIIMWIAWAGAFFIAALGVVGLLYGKQQQRIWTVLLGVVTIVATVAIPALYEWLKPGAVQELVRIFLFRVSNRVAAPTDLEFTAAEFFARWLFDWLTILSPAMTVFGIWGLGRILFLQKTVNHAIIWGLFLAPLLFLVVFRNAFFFHDWYEIHFMPALSVAGAALIYHLWTQKPEGLKRYLKPLVLAICLSSFGISLFWTIHLHEVFDPFVPQLTEGLNANTTAADFIASNSRRPYDEVAYYAERNVRWGILLPTLREYIESNPNQSFYYLYCIFEDDLSEDTSLLDAYPSVTVAEICQLYQIEKGES